VSDQDETRADEHNTDEQMQDLDVAQEQQDDVTGGAARKRGPRSITGDSAAAK
jgi:hypothetical protein